MRIELLSKANQLQPAVVFVNDKSLCKEEIVLLQRCSNPPKKLRPGHYWYDKMSGFWGKEGQKPCQIISPHLNVGDPIKQNASNGNTNVLINNREITKVELLMLQLAGVECVGNPHFWMTADGTIVEEGMPNERGRMWDKTGMRLVCSVLSLPIPSEGSKKAEERFITNGRILLEKLIGSWNGKCSPIRSFSAKELEQATNDYDPANVLCYEGEYKWYKGSIKGRVVSIKKSEDNWYVETFNDIVAAAQLTTHNNILKLIGCCLETHFPIAVYEFAENGTLSSHIHFAGRTTPPPQPLTWKSRLRIATEVASAVTYLHTASRKPIIHRDIKPSNVFLDQHNVAKLSGFENSIAIPEGATHVEDKVIGSFGYLSPEYMATALVTKKIDVYSFGVLLMELLSGPKIYADGSDLLIYFRTHVLSNEDNQVLDPTILQEVGQIDVQQQVRAVSELALRCTETNMEERPTMLDVARQLLQLRRTMVSH